MSSGKPSTPTVLGRFRVYSKTPGTNSEGMVDSNYFIRGYAIHGYAEVPAYAASHGCLRIPIPNAPAVFAWVQVGYPVDVYTEDGAREPRSCRVLTQVRDALAILEPPGQQACEEAEAEAVHEQHQQRVDDVDRPLAAGARGHTREGGGERREGFVDRFVQATLVPGFGCGGGVVAGRRGRRVDFGLLVARRVAGLIDRERDETKRSRSSRSQSTRVAAIWRAWENNTAAG